jgi:hypothetical protein
MEMQKRKNEMDFFFVNLQEKKIVLNYKQKIFKKVKQIQALVAQMAVAYGC